MDNLACHISYLPLCYIDRINTKAAGPRSHKKDGVNMVQQLRKSITALAFFAISGLAAAQAPSAPLTLRPDAPDRYVVVPGDTLWGISQRYTDSPWRWPELWGLNKDQIRNPHLIYPGNVILLDRASGRLSIGGAPGKPGATTSDGSASARGTMKLEPRIRSQALLQRRNGFFELLGVRRSSRSSPVRSSSSPTGWKRRRRSSPPRPTG